MSIGQRVKELRVKNGYTQQDIADLLGCGRSNIGHIENDRVKLESDYATKLANKFNTSVNYILTGIDDSNADTDIRTLQRAAQKMSPEERKKAIKLLEAMFDDVFDED